MPRNPAGLDRVIISLETREVWLDAVMFVVNHPTALQVLQRIAQDRGRIVSHAQLERIPGCRCGKKRFDRLLKKHLPPALRSLIVGIRGPNGGYTLRLPPRKEVHNSPEYGLNDP